jgi:hypothetical protein
MMAAVAGVQAASATLSTTTVDTVTLTGKGNLLTVVNRAASDGTTFWITYNATAGTAATPTAAGDECYPVPPGNGAISFRIRSVAAVANGLTVKILGDGHAYTVMLTDAPGS